MGAKVSRIVLMSKERQDEIEELTSDPILNLMLAHIPKDVGLDDIPFKTVNDTYKRLGGKHKPLTLGSLKRALIEIRNRFK